MHFSPWPAHFFLFSANQLQEKDHIQRGIFCITHTFLRLIHITWWEEVAVPNVNFTKFFEQTPWIPSTAVTCPFWFWFGIRLAHIPILQSKSPTFGFWRRIKGFTIYGRGGHLAHVTKTRALTLSSLHMNQWYQSLNMLTDGRKPES